MNSTSNGKEKNDEVDVKLRESYFIFRSLLFCASLNLVKLFNTSLSQLSHFFNILPNLILGV